MSRFMLGNCVQIMSEFPDNAVDFILTDPPYRVFAISWKELITDMMCVVPSRSWQEQKPKWCFTKVATPCRRQCQVTIPRSIFRLPWNG